MWNVLGNICSAQKPAVDSDLLTEVGQAAAHHRSEVWSLLTLSIHGDLKWLIWNVEWLKDLVFFSHQKGYHHVKSMFLADEE